MGLPHDSLAGTLAAAATLTLALFAVVRLLTGAGS